MPSQRASRSRFAFWGIVAGISTIALIAGGGTAWWTQHHMASKSVPSVPSKVPDAPQPSSSPVSQAPTEQTVQVYWLKSVDDRIEPTASPVTIAATDQPDIVLKAAFEEMLQGSSDPALTSVIPDGTKIRSVEVKSDGIYVDLSQEFTSGGGSMSMMGRVAQVIYTATTLDPEAQVWLSVEGKPLNVLGGEGLMLDQPMTRESFKQNFAL
ncbi:MAG: spore germination protein [Cyanobacteria bacterium CRU_2_1]|nr:spore germination protein [Cyanobacteria bacterium RU_5_0]NJR57973.1 spore germination protein [Cyanobacteria bacterium CRU_2_1]